jgi:hypothetical protein
VAMPVSCHALHHPEQVADPMSFMCVVWHMSQPCFVGGVALLEEQARPNGTRGAETRCCKSKAMPVVYKPLVHEPTADQYV